MVTRDAEGARRRRGQERHAGQGAPLSALDGVPITVKDSLLVRAARDLGHAALRRFGRRRRAAGRAAARAGAVIIGKTNVPEFTIEGYTDNPLFGPTGNPWNPALTPGGSSGGAVAAVAGGIAPLAIAQDGGGSIRRPASHAGLVGLKPTVGRVPRGDGLPAMLLDFEVAARSPGRWPTSMSRWRVRRT